MSPTDAKTCPECGVSLLTAFDKTSRSRVPVVGAKRTKLSGPQASVGARGSAAMPNEPVRTIQEEDAASTLHEDPGSTLSADDPGKTSPDETIDADRRAPAKRKGAAGPAAGVIAGSQTNLKRSSAAAKSLASAGEVSTGGRDTLVGQKLQEYVIEGKLGSGGMGIVYKAVQPMIGKYVAIKVLRGDVVTDPREMERLLDEARVVNSIKNRGIINIFGAGTLEDGRHYLIMELLEGEALDELMAREGKVAPADAVAILEQVLSALAAAHAAGIVHRDLKPANIFLVKEGTSRYVKLLDFGLARRKQEVTRIAGTPDYISPEHAKGRPAGPPADLYAFGVLCFHMLTGQLPFIGNTPMEVMEKHVHHHPPVPHEVNPGIPKALSELILKLLAKDPGERPDAQQVKADLRAATKQLRSAQTMMSLQSIEPVASERPDDDAERARAKELARAAVVADLKRKTNRNRPLLFAIGIALWLLAVLVYVMWPSPPVAPVSPPKSVRKVQPAPAPAPTPTPAPTGDATAADAPLGADAIEQWKSAKHLDTRFATAEEKLKSVKKAFIPTLSEELAKAKQACATATTLGGLNDCDDKLTDADGSIDALMPK